MKLQIENLKAKMRGEDLNSYQKGLALDEYYRLIDYVDELEQKLHQHGVTQGMPDDDELVSESLRYGDVKWPNVEGIYAAGHWIAGARWVMDKLSSNLSVASEGQGDAKSVCEGCKCEKLDDGWAYCENCLAEYYKGLSRI